MAIHFTEDEVEFTVANTGKPCKTWYKIFGKLDNGRTPLVVAHGGPGMGHDYLLPIQELATLYDIPVIFYDQIGTGRSTHLQEKNGDEKFWDPQLFRDELDNLIDKLNIRGSFDFLGQSWGGMLGASYAITKPKGLRRLIISNSPASMNDWLAAAAKLLAQLPQDVRETLEKHEEAGTTDSEEYEQAVMVFYRRHLCLTDPLPKAVVASLDWVKKDPTVYHTMNGPSEFHVIGSLKNWSLKGQLHNIEVPTFIINGKHDEATDDTLMPYFQEIPKVKWISLDNSAHLPMHDEKDRYLQIVGEFLR